jgi:3',5'-cyclic AMP phosphodiesterase CpdA
MILAQVTDMHIKTPGMLAYRKVDTAAHLARAVAALNALAPQPDLVALTGDLVDFGKPEEYEHLRTLLAPLRAPYLLLPGNHDERTALRAAFPEHDYLPRAGFLQYATDCGPLRLVALDTLIPMQGGGELCAERLAWLDQTLAAAPDRPTVVMMHHPPFLTGIAHMDEQGLAGREGFTAVIRRHLQVERIICGHLHRSIQCRVAHTVASTCPAPCHQVALDLRADGPSAFVLEPPGFQLHQWIEGTGLVTHTAVIGEYDGPHPFHDAAGRLID